MSEHARLSFSASERWLRCPASVNMTRNIPDSGGSLASEEGTFAHSLLERAVNRWIITDEVRWNPAEIPAQYDQNMNEHLNDAFALIVAEVERLRDMGQKDIRVYAERKVDMHYLTGRDDTWGTADIIVESEDYLIVIDLKYGKGVFVEADTTQNRLYLLGAMCPTMKKTKGDMPWVSVKGVIIQPRYPDAEGEIIRDVEFTPEELDSWFHETVAPAMKLTDEPPPPVPGEKQCRWCLAKPTCPAVKQQVADACSVFLPVEGAAVSEAVVPSIDEAVTDDELANLLQVHDQIPFINGYLKAVSERIRKLLEQRDPRLHGRLKLVVSRRTTKWSESDHVVVDALVAGKGRTVKDGYIPRKTLVKESPLSAAQALKLKLNKAQKERLQELISKTEGGLSIVPWSDPRDNAAPPIPFEAADKQYDFL